jgi:hypothetical protein
MRKLSQGLGTSRFANESITAEANWEFLWFSWQLLQHEFPRELFQVNSFAAPRKR